MNDVRINEKEVIVMNLVHYFVTEKNYNPVVVHGINDEIWLENMENDYRIIRIISRYIHNDEQLGFNLFRSKQITKKLRKKTFSFKMPVLSIYVNLGENVKSLNKENDSSNLSVFVKELQDFKNNSSIIEVFPDIIEKTYHDEKGLELLIKITDDINNTNERKNEKMEKIFKTKKPIITYILISLCVLIFILMGGSTDNEVLVNWGANYGPLIKNGELYRIVSSMFIHIGFVHIFFNMYSLYIVGPRVEDFFGKWKYLFIYILSGICGSLLSVGFNDNVISAGASGAIFGLFGALLYFGYTYRGYIGSMVKSQILPVVLYNLVLGFFISGIDMAGHIGGLIGGLLVSSMLGTIENKKYKFENILLFVTYFVFLIYLALFI